MLVKVRGSLGQGPATEVTHLGLNQSPVFSSSTIKTPQLLHTLTIVSFSLEVFLGYGYLLRSIFPLLLEASTENLNQASLNHSLWHHKLNQTHSLASFQWSGLFNQQTLRLTENCLQIWKWCPYKGRGVVSAPICAKKVRNGPASADQGCSITSLGSCRVHGTS